MTEPISKFSPLAHLPKWRPIREFNAPAQVAAEALNVTPDLLGKPLAKPSRRLWAILIDLAIVGLMSSITGLWLLLVASFVGWRLRRRLLMRSWWLATPLAVLFTILLLAGADAVWQGVQLDKPHKVVAGVEAETEAAVKKEIRDADRIAQLENELAQAKKPKLWRWGDEISSQLHAIGAGFGWAIIYFSLVPFLWRGQTVGKRLLRLRIMELTGKRLTIFHCFSRYGGYAAGMATGMFGFAQVLWDANRQAIQDKIAHTVVIDERASQRADHGGALLS